jgi:hypothetical protein
MAGFLSALKQPSARTSTRQSQPTHYIPSNHQVSCDLEDKYFQEEIATAERLRRLPKLLSSLESLSEK